MNGGVGGSAGGWVGGGAGTIGGGGAWGGTAAIQSELMGVTSRCVDCQPHVLKEPSVTKS